MTRSGSIGGGPRAARAPDKRCGNCDFWQVRRVLGQRKFDPKTSRACVNELSMASRRAVTNINYSCSEWRPIGAGMLEQTMKRGTGA